MAISIRPAQASDLTRIDPVIVSAINDLTELHGFGPMAKPSPPLFQTYSFNDDPLGLWVAADENDVVGFAFSWVCEDLWFLAQLFVRPGVQQGGIGRQLITRTLDHARQSGARRRALITFAFNRASLGLYIRNGLFPLWPIYMMSGERSGPAQAEAGLEARPLTPGEPLDFMDREALGLSRAKHHLYLGQLAEMKGLSLWHKGQCVGYAYVGTDGHVGPLAVISPELAGPALRAAFDYARQNGATRVSAFVPGPNHAALTTAMEAGLRIRMPMLLMANEPFGHWDRYMPRNPGLM